MTAKLQRRFILAAMAAVTLLMVIMLGALNVFNIVMAAHISEHTLEILCQEYRRPDRDPFDRTPEELPHIDRFHAPVDRDTVDAARYFYVELDQDGEVTYMNLDRIAAVDEVLAIEYISCVQELGTVDGIVDGFRYCTVWQTPGCAMIFLSLEEQGRQIVSVLGLSTAIGIAAWVSMLGIVILLSRHAIRPVAVSIEKQKQFVTDAGHELKTPLAIIRANVDALELHQGASKWSGNIRGQTDRLGGLMQNLLTLSRADEGLPMPEMGELSPGCLLRESLQNYQEAAALKGVLIDDEIDDDLRITASRDHLSRLYALLLDNAVQYVPQGGVIGVRLHGGRRMVLEISNTCPEPPCDDLEKLFDRFYRGDAARTQRSGGSGIGLSAARAIATAHRGTLRADHRDGIITFILEI